MKKCHRGLCVAALWLAPAVCWSGLAPHAVAGEFKPAAVLSDGTQVHFLSRSDAARAILDDASDPFFERLTLLDIELQVGHKLESKDLARGLVELKKTLKACVRDWTPEETQSVMTALQSAHAKCKKVAPAMLPKAWRFIKLCGGLHGAPYTRGDCIVIPEPVLQSGVDEHLILHEGFHVYSRGAPKMRDALYKLIGFEHLANVSLPAALEKRRLTNPDGVDFGYAIDVTDQSGRKLKVVPLIFSKHDSLQDGVEGFFRYLDFALFEVKLEGETWSVVADDKGQAKPISPGAIGGFFEKIGRNTGYIIHPDEILADNAALLILSRSGDKSARVGTPELLTKIERALSAE